MWKVPPPTTAPPGTDTASRPRRRFDFGFTLIELVVVVVVIAIIAAIAIPSYLSQRTQAFDATVKSDLKSVAMELETRYDQYLTDPADLEALITSSTSEGVAMTAYTDTGGAQSKFVLFAQHERSENCFALSSFDGSIPVRDDNCEFDDGEHGAPPFSEGGANFVSISPGVEGKWSPNTLRVLLIADSGRNLKYGDMFPNYYTAVTRVDTTSTSADFLAKFPDGISADEYDIVIGMFGAWNFPNSAVQSAMDAFYNDGGLVLSQSNDATWITPLYSGAGGGPALAAGSVPASQTVRQQLSPTFPSWTPQTRTPDSHGAIISLSNIKPGAVCVALDPARTDTCVGVAAQSGTGRWAHSHAVTAEEAFVVAAGRWLVAK